MKVEGSSKEPEVDFTQLGPGGNAKTKSQTHSNRISHIKMASGEWLGIVKGSFNLYKTNEGVPFVEFKVESEPENGFVKNKTIQLFPATVAGWAFDDD